jgi:peptide/nickel transport system permease protein
MANPKTIYLFKRILLSIPTLLAISVVIFTILAIAPGDPMGEFATNPAITAEVKENIKKSLGLDQPLAIRYFKWLWAFLNGDLGYSFTSRSAVIELIKQRLPATLSVVGIAYIMGVIIAFPLGIFSAIKRRSWLDQTVTFLSFLGISLPTFLTGLFLILIFTVQLKWLPSVYSSTLHVKDLTTFLEQIRQSILPIAVLTLYQASSLVRYIRAAVLEELSQDYLRTAMAKGLSLNQAITNHVLKNALIPVVTLIALEIPAIFTGALVTEQIFRVPGIGALLIESINRSDTPVVMGITFTYGILIVMFNLLADLLYGFLDPRIKYD